MNALILELPFPPSEEIWRDVAGYEGYYQISITITVLR